MKNDYYIGPASPFIAPILEYVHVAHASNF